MTRRVYAFHVILDKEYREDDIQSIIDAIKLFGPVADVKTHVGSLQTTAAYVRARQDIIKQIYRLLEN